MPRAAGAHEPSLRKETGIALGIYIGLGGACSVSGCWVFSGPTVRPASSSPGGVTEYSLSVDNLFVFMHHHGRKFASAPASYQQEALLIGIVARAGATHGSSSLVGAAAINQFSWIFYIFGAFLIYTAVKLAR